MLTGTLEQKPASGAAAGNRPCGVVRDDRVSAVESDPAAIIAALRGEMDRVQLTDDSSCICIVSPDVAIDDLTMGVLGEWISSRLRSLDALYRFADDKYLVMLREVDRGGAVKLIKRLRDQVMSEPVPSDSGGGAVNVTVSFGGTMLDSTAPLHEHMDRASEAHSWALKGMGDTICMWTPKF